VQLGTGNGDNFRFVNENFFTRSRKSRNCAETHLEYVAQAIPKIDAEIVEKGHLHVENKKSHPTESGWLKAYYITQKIKSLCDFI
jgi:hypothetical protein